MKCPECGGEESSVIDSRKQGDHVWRRRRCICEFRFNTLEMIEIDIVQPSQLGETIKLLNDIEKSSRLFLEFVEHMKQKIADATGVPANQLGRQQMPEQKVKPQKLDGNSVLVDTALKESACSVDVI